MDDCLVILYDFKFQQITIFCQLIISQLNNKTSAMGCQSSSGVNQLHDHRPSKRNIQSGFKDAHRAKLLQAIQWNDPCDYAVAAQQHNIPINAELSEKGLFWMSSHFCCRFNAFKVLDYVLKTAYVEDPKDYHQYVNEQTVEGLTCIHLCAIWNAPECLQLLLKFGGINLQLKDKTQASGYFTAVNYKRNDMKSILKQYEDLGIKFLNVQHQKLSSGDILALQTVDTQTKSKPNQNFTTDLNGGLKNAMANIFLQTQQEKRLVQEKKKVQVERQNIRLQIKKIQEEQAIKAKEQIRKAEEQRKAKQQRQVQQRQLKLIQQMKKKEEELANLKNSLHKIQVQKQQNMINEEKRKSEEFLIKNQAQFQEKMNQKRSIIEQQKQSVLKSRLQRSPLPQSTIQIRQKVNGTLPAELQKQYNEAKKVGIFADQNFPQNQKSIGNNAKAQKFINDLIWLRPKQIFKGDYELFDGIDPNDIKQGSLGVCYMLATLSTLAQFPQRIKDIFVFHDKALGFYVLKMLIHGSIKYITIDDSIPCSKSTRSPLFAKPNGNQVWVCLVEKAWAKCVGNYMKAQSMTPNHLMEDLTMCPSFGVWFKDKTQKTKDIDTHIKMGNIVVLTSVGDKKIQGIVNNHAYSLLNVYEHEGKNIYKIRNPWGKFQWKGYYNESSAVWTPQLKKKVNYVDADDGIFFLTECELLEAFVYYSISYIKLNNKYSHITLQTKKDENKFYAFELSEDQQINIRFVQQFNRMIDDAQYSYSPVIFEVGKIQSSGQVSFLTEGDNPCFWGAKSVHADPQLIKKYTKGKYFVRIAVQWTKQSKYNTGVFSVFAKEEVKIQQLSTPQGQKNWIQLMKSFALKKGTINSKGNMDYIMTWMRGQMLCYAYGKQAEANQKFEAKWTFDPSKFTNCTWGLNHAEGNDMKYIIGKGKQNAGVGTLKRLAINQGCNSGSVFISATAL